MHCLPLDNRIVTEISNQQGTCSVLLAAWLTLRLSEDGGSIFLRHVGKRLPDYTASLSDYGTSN
jgi:hypothetical protein